MQLMKTILIGSLLLLCSTVFYAQDQVNLSGTLLDQDTEAPLVGATISINGEEIATTNDEGYFEATGTWESPLQLVVRQGDTQIMTMRSQVPDDGYVKLGSYYVDRNISNELDPNLQVINEIDIFDDDDREFSGILSASRDPLAQMSSFDMGWGRYNMRGLRTEYQDFTLNGISVNDMENNRVPFNLWSGMNDMVKSRFDVINLNHVEYTFGNIGGAGSISMRPSDIYSGTRASYAMSNRSYRHRLMVSHNSGMQSNGWGYAFSASRRWGDEGYIEGTFYDGFSYFGALERKLNEKHSLTLNAFGSFVERGTSSAGTQEAYNITGSNFYNPNWGYQNGEKRNARVTKSHTPTVMLTHDWKPSDKLKITTGGLYYTGEYGKTALDWNNAPDARADYYRKFPSFNKFDDVRNLSQEIWATFDTERQVNWHKLYQVNYNAEEITVENINGGSGTFTGQRSHYILEDAHYDPTMLSLASHAIYTANDNWTLNGGIQFKKGMTDNYLEVEDLLGGDFFLDVDNFAERDFTTDFNIRQADLNNPNHVAFEGDKISYHYEVHTQTANAWIQSAWSLSRIDFYLGGQIGNSQYYRDGIFKNGRFPTFSEGKSETASFLTYDAKAGLNFKINGRNYIYANAAYGQKAPNARNGFAAPRVNNLLNPYSQEWNYMSGDLGYQIRTPFVKGRVGVFYNLLNDQTKSSAFFNDFKQAFGYYLQGNIDYEMKGIEGAFQIKVSPTVNANLGFTFGDYKLVDRPLLSSIDDKSLDFDLKDETVYAENFYVPGQPQTVVSFGLEYRSPHYWWVGANMSYYAQNFVDYNPVRRTAFPFQTLEYQGPLWNALVEQEEYDEQIGVNIKGGKSMRLGGKYFLSLFVGVDNVLDNTEARTGGFEQSRFVEESLLAEWFSPKYYYAYGRTFFGSITLRF